MLKRITLLAAAASIAFAAAASAQDKTVACKRRSDAAPASVARTNAWADWNSTLARDRVGSKLGQRVPV